MDLHRPPVGGVFFGESAERPMMPLCSYSTRSDEPSTILHWFRIDSLRLNDNPAFRYAVSTGQRLKAIVILDPWFNSNNRSGPGVNVWRFLLECLHDLDNRLQKKPYQTRLNVFLGQPTLILPTLFKKWNVTRLTFQASQTSMESVKHDEIIIAAAKDYDVVVDTFCSHTLYDPQDILNANNGKFPQTYKDLRRLLPMVGRPKEPFPEPDPVNVFLYQSSTQVDVSDAHIPSLQDLGFKPEDSLYSNPWVGGETEALSRLSNFCSRRASQPDEPISWLISKDSLSPYIRFGCLSVRQIFSQLRQYASTSSKGQMLFAELTKNLLMREFAYIVGTSVPKFDVMQDNPLCIQLPWDQNEESEAFLAAWREGRTGYPWIDAIMRQCVQEGWAHFTARQSIAVFLTRGYLWVNWERGKEFFQEFMLDFELPVSTVCWMQSSCSGFFCDLIESYDPCYIGKQMDLDGHFIKLFIPELKDFPSEYIHTPWLAPTHVQQQAKCVIGKDYPKPIVDVCEQGELCCQRIRSVLTALQDLYGESP